MFLWDRNDLCCIGSSESTIYSAFDRGNRIYKYFQMKQNYFLIYRDSLLKKKLTKYVGYKKINSQKKTIMGLIMNFVKNLRKKIGGNVCIYQL